MSEAVTGILKFTFGLISNKVRSYGAEKLQDGGLTDQKFRGWIVRELDDIKSKLDGLSRKDLFTSISCLQQGVVRVNMCFADSSERDNSSTSEVQDGKQSQDTTNVTARASTSTQTKPVQTSAAVDDAVALANAIGKLNVVSSERFESAKESFKEAGRKAREAFHNTALSTEERILASKVRIASGILEHLHDPEFAANDCLQYLQELHDLQAIQDIFSVHIKTGIKSWMKSGFKKDSRAEIVETVTMINLILADFITKFTKRRMAVFDWPTIKCGKQVVHPIYYKKESLPDSKEMEVIPPWDMVKDLEANISTLKTSGLNKKGDLFCFFEGKPDLQKLDKTTGKLQLCPFNPTLTDNHLKIIWHLVFDEDDTMYVMSGSGNKNDGYLVSVYSADGTNLHRFSLKFLDGLDLNDIKMTVTKDKNIVICFKSDTEEGITDIKVWVGASNGELRNKFVAATDLTEEHNLEQAFVSCNNEIMLITSKPGLLRYTYKLQIYTKDGNLKRTVRFRPSSIDDEHFHRICYNEVTKCIVGYVTWENRHGKDLVEFFSDQTGELICSYLLPKTNLPEDFHQFSNLVCHTSGILALLAGQSQVLFLQTPTV